MEKHTVTIKGEVFNLPPFTAGQMRRQVDPLLKATQELLAKAQGVVEAGEPSASDALDLSVEQRRLACLQGDLVLAALQNQYPHLTLDDVETLTPSRIAQVFNELHLLTTAGDNEPGEVIPPALKKRR